MHDDRLWQAVLGEISVSVSSGNFSTWFKNTKLLRYEDDVLVIGVPNVFVSQQLEKKFKPLIVEALAHQGVKPKTIQYKGLPAAKTNKRIEDDVISLPQTAAKPSTPKSHSLAHSYRQGLRENFTFDNFVVGSSNEFAYAAAQGTAASPGTKYNPLSLFGGVGVGKTHLMQAVGHAVLKENPDAKVTYVTSEQFTQEFIDAVRYKKNTEFANFYRSSDVLIIDDVQFFAGKEKTLEEFFHTFNALYQANKQIIISSDRPPSEITGLEERLKSRFMQGMSIDMQIPDYETRCAIVQTKASVQGMELPQDVVEFLANNLRSNIRELEGALNQLIATCAVKNVQPDVPLAQQVLGSHRMRPKRLTPKQIIERTARHFSVSVDDVLGPKRDKDIVLPRQVAMYLMRSELHLSFPKIASELGRKDHTTAMHSINKIEEEAVVDNTIKSALNDIKGRLYA